MGIHQVVINPVHILHEEKLVSVGVLVVGPTRPILLHHAEVLLVDVFGAGHRFLRRVILTSHLSFLLHSRFGLLKCVQFEPVDQVVDRIDDLPVKDYRGCLKLCVRPVVATECHR